MADEKKTAGEAPATSGKYSNQGDANGEFPGKPSGGDGRGGSASGPKPSPNFGSKPKGE